jgi:hypothetical protein
MITERYRKNIAAGLSAIEVQISGQDKSCDTDFSMRAIQFNRVCPFNFMVYYGKVSVILFTVNW